MSVTFHRAFDVTPDPEASMDLLLELGVDRVLTSGTRWGSSDSALKGRLVLEKLIRQAEKQIEIVIGGGIAPDNAGFLLNSLPVNVGCLSVHAYSSVLCEGEVSAQRVRELREAVDKNY